MARKGRSKSGGSGTFNSALHPRDAKGRFIRTRALAAGAARFRRGIPGANSSLRSALAPFRGDDKQSVAIRIKALPEVKGAAALRQKFLKEGNTEALRGRLATAVRSRTQFLDARSAQLGEKRNLARLNSRSAETNARNAAAAAEAKRAARVNAKIARAEAKRAEAARVAEEARAQGVINRQRMIDRGYINRRSINNPTGYRDFMNRTPVAEPGQIAMGRRAKSALVERIAQLNPGADRGSTAIKFAQHGDTPKLRRKLARNEETTRSQLSTSYRNRNRTSPAPSSQGTVRTLRDIPPGSTKVYNVAAKPAASTNPRVKGIRAAIARSTMPIGTSEANFRASNLGGSRALPGYNGSTKQSLGLSARSTKQRLADRIRQLGVAEKQNPVINSYKRHGLGTATMAEIRNQESRRATALAASGRQRAAAAHAQAAMSSRDRMLSLAGSNQKHIRITEELLASPMKDLTRNITSANHAILMDTFSKVSPTEFNRLLTNKLPPGATISYSLSGSSLGWSARGGRVTIIDKNGHPKVIENVIQDISRSMNLSSKTVDHSFFQVHHEAQGGLIGKPVFRDLFELYASVGIKKVMVHANISVGGYAWARYGFKSDRGDSNRTVASWIDSFKNAAPNKNGEIPIGSRHSNNPIANETKFKLTTPQISRLNEYQKAMRSGDTKAIWRLADDPEPLVNAKGVIQKDDTGKPMTLGKAVLLGGRHWYGTIHLDNAENRARTFKYVGLEDRWGRS